MEAGDFWIGGALGTGVGLTLGLAWSLTITHRLVGLGARMGVMVRQSERLSVHVSREYAPIRERLERVEREIESIKSVLGERT